MGDLNWDKLDESWAGASVEKKDTGTDYDPVPDGRYVCVIDRVSFKESKAGNPYLNWVLIVENGHSEGRWLFKRNMLESSQNMVFLKKDLATCGVELPEKISELNLESLLDKKVEVTKKTKNDFENIYIDRLLVTGSPFHGIGNASGVPSDDPTHTPGDAAEIFGGNDDDIPF
tara:strand:+ start:247 stop:765 length:519 start_codon:yes stop_codon:yes gene_type:complete